MGLVDGSVLRVVLSAGWNPGPYAAEGTEYLSSCSEKCALGKQRPRVYGEADREFSTAACKAVRLTRKVEKTTKKRRFILFGGAIAIGPHLPTAE